MTVDYVLSIERRTLARSNHKPVVLPVGACPKLFLHLPLAMASEGFCGPLEQIYGAPAGVLGLAGHQPNSPTASYICETQIYVPQECKLDELRAPNSHPEAQ